MQQVTKRLVPVVVLAILLTSAYFLGLNKTSPLNTAEAYLILVKNRDFDQAYQLVNPNDTVPTLAESFYIGWQKNLDTQLVSYSNLKTDWRNFWKPASLGAEVTCTYTATHRSEDKNKTSQATLRLVQVGNYWGIFPKWQVKLPYETLTISSETKGAQIKLDGVKLFGRTEQLPLTVEVFAGDHQVEIYDADAQPIVIKKVRNNAKVPYLTAKEDLLDATLKGFEDAWQSAHNPLLTPQPAQTGQGKSTNKPNEQNPSIVEEVYKNEIGQYFTFGSPKLHEFEQILQERLSIKKGLQYSYTSSWQQQSYELKEATLLDPETVQITVQETWLVTNKYSDGTQSSPTPFGATWQATFKKVGEKWLIE